MIASLACATEGLVLTGALERPGHTDVGRPVRDLVTEAPPDLLITEATAVAFGPADVIIDFTAPEATLAHLEAAVVQGKGMIIGTTGFTPQERRRLEDLAGKTATVISANFSVGINLLLAVLPQIATALGDDYDIEILETHHRFKADAPSGTALALAEAVAAPLGRDLAKEAVYGRSGRPGPRTKREIGILAARAGDVVGDHTVMFGGLGERIEVTHRAHSREVLARGALRAAGWIAGRPAGLYSMLDVLGMANKEA
jgi:4-hydroxy-tetrahydrodipicolinate reductase